MSLSIETRSIGDITVLLCTGLIVDGDESRALANTVDTCSRSVLFRRSRSGARAHQLMTQGEHHICCEECAARFACPSSGDLRAPESCRPSLDYRIKDNARSSTSSRPARMPASVGVRLIRCRGHLPKRGCDVVTTIGVAPHRSIPDGIASRIDL